MITNLTLGPVGIFKIKEILTRYGFSSDVDYSVDAHILDLNYNTITVSYEVCKIVFNDEVDEIVFLLKLINEDKDELKVIRE